MQCIFIDNHDRILYYSNPAGYIAGKEAVVDTMFQTQELERFLQKQALPIRWEDGVYDRLLLGQRGGRFNPEAPPLKSCRVWLFRDPVPGYDGRPIGISDVLELYDVDGSEFYYCDRVGFRQIEFAPRQEMDLRP